MRFAPAWRTEPLSAILLQHGSCYLPANAGTSETELLFNLRLMSESAVKSEWKPAKQASADISPALRAEPGTYALILVSSRQSAVTVGRLGRMRLRPGFTSMSAAHSGREESARGSGITSGGPRDRTGISTT